MSSTPSASRPSLLPKEHGAYAQLGLSLAAALVLAPGSYRAWAQALATAAAFLAGEPFLVLMGRRGAQDLNPARKRLGGLAFAMIVLVAVAWLGTPASPLLALLPPLLPALGLLGLSLVRKEHSAEGELLGSVAFSLAATPVILLGGRSWGIAAGFAGSLALLHALGSSIVRCHLRALRGTPLIRLLPLLLGASLVLTAALARLPWPWIAAPLPVTLVALLAFLHPPGPKDLRRVGWMLAAASTMGAALVLAVLS